MAEEPPVDPAEERFAAEARTAGLVLPPPKRFGLENIAVAFAISVLIVGASIVIGHAEGWFNPVRPTESGPDLQGPQDCGGGPASVPLNLAVEANASVALTAGWENLTSLYVTGTGDCVVASTSAGGMASLTSFSADGLIGPDLSLSASYAGLGTKTYAVPLLVSPLVVVYNLNGSDADLNLSAAALAGAYLGSISSWTSPELTAINPGLDSSLPVTPIELGGPSQANEVFSSYLAEWNASFRTEVGAGWQPPWPAGLAAASPSALLSLVAGTPGAIGYEPTDVCPSLPSNVSCARVETGNTSFVTPSFAGTWQAANATLSSSGVTSGAWVNDTGVAPTTSAAYPMVEVTGGLLYRDLGSAYGGSLGLNQAQWLMSMFWWIGSAIGTTVVGSGYYALPSGFTVAVETVLAKVAYDGTSILFPNGEENGETGNETGEF